MTREQLRDQYGSDPEAVQSIEKFATAHKLVVTRTSPPRRGSARRHCRRSSVPPSASRCSIILIRVSATSTPAPDRSRSRPNSGMLSPACSASTITVPCTAVSQPSGNEMRCGSAAQSRPWFVPTELGAIYNFPHADAQQPMHRSARIRRRGGESDVAAYFEKIGVPAPTLAIVAVDGVSTDPAGDPEFDR